MIDTLQLTATVLAPTVYSAFATVISKLVPEPDPLQMFVGVALNVTVGFGYTLTFIVFVDTDFGQPSDVLVIVDTVAEYAPGVKAPPIPARLTPVLPEPELVKSAISAASPEKLIDQLALPPLLGS